MYLGIKYWYPEEKPCIKIDFNPTPSPFKLALTSIDAKHIAVT
jgi:hypothetical protein